MATDTQTSWLAAPTTRTASIVEGGCRCTWVRWTDRRTRSRGPSKAAPPRPRWALRWRRPATSTVTALPTCSRAGMRKVPTPRDGRCSSWARRTGSVTSPTGASTVSSRVRAWERRWRRPATSMVTATPTSSPARRTTTTATSQRAVSTSSAARRPGSATTPTGAGSRTDSPAVGLPWLRRETLTATATPTWRWAATPTLIPSSSRAPSLCSWETPPASARARISSWSLTWRWRRSVARCPGQAMSTATGTPTCWSGPTRTLLRISRRGRSSSTSARPWASGPARRGRRWEDRPRPGSARR